MSNPRLTLAELVSIGAHAIAVNPALATAEVNVSEVMEEGFVSRVDIFDGVVILACIDSNGVEW